MTTLGRACDPRALGPDRSKYQSENSKVNPKEWGRNGFIDRGVLRSEEVISHITGQDFPRSSLIPLTRQSPVLWANAFAPFSSESSPIYALLSLFSCPLCLTSPLSLRLPQILSFSLSWTFPSSSSLLLSVSFSTYMDTVGRRATDNTSSRLCLVTDSSLCILDGRTWQWRLSVKDINVLPSPHSHSGGWWDELT